MAEKRAMTFPEIIDMVKNRKGDAWQETKLPEIIDMVDEYMAQQVVPPSPNSVNR